MQRIDLTWADQAETICPGRKFQMKALAVMASMLLTVAVLTGCGTTPVRLVETGNLVSKEPQPEVPAALTPAPQKSPPSYRAVTFPLDGADGEAPDPQRLETIVQFALGLVERGEPVKAAAFLVEAADDPRADSRRNEFRIALLSAAATLYLQGGDVEKLKEVTGQLRKQLDPYQSAAADPRLSLILAIANMMQRKRPEISAELPWAVRNLFQEGAPK